MRFFLHFFILFSFFLVSCGDVSREEGEDQSFLSQNQQTKPEISVVYLSDQWPLVLHGGDSLSLRAGVLFSDGYGTTYQSGFIRRSSDTWPILWSSTDTRVATITPDGVVWARGEGQTTLVAQISDKKREVSLAVLSEEEQALNHSLQPPPPVQPLPLPPPSEPEPDSSLESVPSPEPVSDPVADPKPNPDPVSKNPDPLPEASPEPPPDKTKDDPPPKKEIPLALPLVAESFLGTNDAVAWVKKGAYSGYGQHLFPGILYGFPREGNTHAVSFGAGGILKIELHGYGVADGPGPDFVIFENPFLLVNGEFYREFAKVSVSPDDQTYYTYSCSPKPEQNFFDACAGVAPATFESEDIFHFLDPAVSGGDLFDLADSGFEWIRFIMIEDLSRVEDLIPFFAANGKAGFDLDAVGIVNGVEEKFLH